MHTPRKRFGQHFLCDPLVISNIIAAISPKRDDHLIEIGPGQGAITIPLLEYVETLEVVELDRDLIPNLMNRAHHNPHLMIHQADALVFDFGTLKKDKRLLRMVGNLPYNISTPLLFHLLSYTNLISDMVFMLQKEVAERIAAEPSSPHYGRLSVMMQYYCETELLFDVSPNAFYPPPKVDSSIIRLAPHQEKIHSARDEKYFSEIVKAAFEMRRKTLRNSLKNWIDDASWEKIGIDPQLRAENLSVYDFVKMSNHRES